MDNIRGQGKLIFPDGTFYEGNWLQGKFNGKGILKYSNGISLEGIFLMDSLMEKAFNLIVTVIHTTVIGNLEKME